MDPARSPRDHLSFIALCLALGLAAPGTAQGQKGVQALLARLQSKDPQEREDAVFDLGRLGPKAPSEVVVALTHVLQKDPSPEVRGSAAQALGDLGPAALPALSTLLEASRDEDSDLRGDSVHTIGEIGPGAASAVPRLHEIVKTDPVLPVRLSAYWSLGQLGAAARPCAPTMLATLALRKLPPDLQGHGGPFPEHLRPSILRVLRQAAVSALGGLGEAIPETASALKTVCRDTSEPLGLRTRAAIALARLGLETGSALPVLSQSLHDKDAGLRIVALEGLGLIGPRAAPLLEQIRPALQDKDKGVRKAAADALRAVEGPGR